MILRYISGLGALVFSSYLLSCVEVPPGNPPKHHTELLSKEQLEECIDTTKNEERTRIIQSNSPNPLSLDQYCNSFVISFLPRLEGCFGATTPNFSYTCLYEFSSQEITLDEARKNCVDANSALNSIDPTKIDGLGNIDVSCFARDRLG